MSLHLNQITNHVALVKPTYFNINLKGTEDNHFGESHLKYNHTDILNEFNKLIKICNINHISYTIYDSPKDAPDAVFPNNWISFHWETDHPIVVIYPMKAEHRQKERCSQLSADLFLGKMKPNIDLPIEIVD